MSISQVTYVLFGQILSYDIVDFEACEPYFPENRAPGDAVIIYDGMSGKWIAIGVVIDKFVGMDGFNDPVQLLNFPLAENLAKVRELARTVFGLHPASLSLSYIVLTHYQ